MLHQTDGLSPHSPLRPLSVLVLHLLLTHSCRGQSQVIGPPHPIVAAVGDDIILPCHLEPVADLTAEILEWKRSDPSPRFVHVWRAGHDLVNVKNPSYRGRTSVFTDELKHGNISLKLSKVQLSDQGTYECDIPLLRKQSSVKLIVASDAASSPDISLLGIDRNRGRVILNCESEGWYPEPEVFWLDSEGNLLSAGPTETVRGPDDLYTVSSRVTVEKRHSNSFTCRVQQKNINQIRETHIQISDDFFEVQSSSAVPIIIGSAVCIVFILLLVIFVWRQNKNKTKRSHRDETDTGERKNQKKNKTEDQFVTEEEREREQLMADETVQMEVLKGKGEKKTKCQLQEEQQRRKEAENRVKTLKVELETKKNEVEIHQAELQQLREEKQKKENDLQNLKEELENKNKELERIQTPERSFFFSWIQGPSIEEQQKKNELETLKKNLETIEKELDAKTKEFEDKQVEYQPLQDEYQRMETNLQTLMEDQETNNFERS